jgi:hypothetical protein
VVALLVSYEVTSLYKASESPLQFYTKVQTKRSDARPTHWMMKCSVKPSGMDIDSSYMIELIIGFPSSFCAMFEEIDEDNHATVQLSK